SNLEYGSNYHKGNRKGSNESSQGSSKAYFQRSVEKQVGNSNSNNPACQSAQVSRPTGYNKQAQYQQNGYESQQNIQLSSILLSYNAKCPGPSALPYYCTTSLSGRPERKNHRKIISQNNQ